MSDDSADFTGTFQPVYTVNLAPSGHPRIETISDRVPRAKLSLVLQDHASLARPIVNPPNAGAILGIHMSREQAVEIYTTIRQFFSSMDWPLPE